ncbi:MAG: glutaredoxin 3 [Candidatus Melainabacteria bacterium GWF2_32_7]|nr:MAG: glutaredoxin 3 [Candidatus Melainabacteria bacterium GWF2_32_7]
MAKVLTYTVDYCPYCKKAKALLREKGVDFEDIDITANEDEMREKLSEITGGRTTVPQIFINGVHVGGYTDLKALNDSGKLDEMLIT